MLLVTRLDYFYHLTAFVFQFSVLWLTATPFSDLKIVLYQMEAPGLAQSPHLTLVRDLVLWLFKEKTSFRVG